MRVLTLADRNRGSDRDEAKQLLNQIFAAPVGRHDTAEELRVKGYARDAERRYGWTLEQDNALGGSARELSMIAMRELESAPRGQPKGGRGTVVGMFKDRVAATPERTDARQKLDGQRRDVSWRALAERAAKVSHALLAMGVQRADRVCLMG